MTEPIVIPEEVRDLTGESRPRSIASLGMTVGAWGLAMAIAAMLDKPIAIWMRDNGIDAWMKAHERLAEILKAPGSYSFTVCVAIAVILFHPLRLRGGAFVLLATLISGVNGTIKWIVGRTRPFKLDPNAAQPFVLSPFRGGFGGMFESKNLCFPSGHAALAFATAAAVAILWPRARWRW